MRKIRRVPVALLAITAVCIVSSCASLGQRTADAALVSEAASKTLDQELAVGQLRTNFELTERPDNLELNFDPETARLDVLLPYQFNLAERRAQIVLPNIFIERLAELDALTDGADFDEFAEGAQPTGAPLAPGEAPAGAGVSPALLYDGTTTYTRRVSTKRVDSRNWQVLDFTTLEGIEGAASVREFGDRRGGVELLNPTFLVELLAGVLTGSVERVGDEDIRGEKTSHFKLNVSFEKSETELDLDDDAKETRAKLRELLAVVVDVHEAEVWVDAGGLVRQVTIKLEQAPRRKFEFETTYTLEFVTFGVVEGAELPPLEPPSSGDTVRIKSIATLLGSQKAVTAVGAIMSRGKPDDGDPVEAEAPASEGEAL